MESQKRVPQAKNVREETVSIKITVTACQIDCK